MNLLQISKLNSYIVMRGVIVREIDVMNCLPAFKNRFAAFDKSIGQIEAAAKRQCAVDNSEMFRYQTSRESLIKQCASLSKKLVLYADTIGDAEMRGEVEHSEYKLRRMQKSDFAHLASLLLERATTAAAQGIYVSITQQDIDNAEKNLNAFLKNMDALRHRQLKISENTRRLAKAFAAAKAAIEKLFLTLTLLSDTHPLIYSELEDASKLIVSYKSLSLKGEVVEENTEYPIGRISLEIRRIGDQPPKDIMMAKPEVKKITNKNGRFLMKSLPQGTYLLTASKLGFKTVNLQFHILPSETTRLKVMMTKD